jgi:two-component system LytT family response regulator
MSDTKIKVLIIDSNREFISELVEMLQENPTINEIETAQESNEALIKLLDFAPDMIILEYPLKGSVGSKLLRYINSKFAEATIIYVSDSKKYAINAIHDSVFNFMIKPVSKRKIENTVKEALLKKQTNIQERFNQIIEKTPNEIKLKFQTSKGYLLVKSEEVLFFKASSLYSEIYFTDGRTELCFMLLSKIEQILEGYNFFRVSRSIIINAEYIRRVNRTSGLITLSQNGKEYEIKGSKNQVKNIFKMEDE